MNNGKKTIWALKHLFFVLIISGCGGGGGSSGNGQMSSNDNENTSTPETPAQANTANTELKKTISCGNSSFTEEQALFLINQIRAKAQQCGSKPFPAAPALSWNQKLASAAEKHSKDMSSINFFSHTSSNGLSVGDRAKAENYLFRAIGENIAGGQSSLESALQSWLNSPGHCANMMNPTYKEVGLACSYDNGSDLKYYWTQVFGTQQTTN